MNPIVSLISLVLNVFQLLLLIRVLLSWFPQVDRSNPIIRLVEDITEPVLAPVRQMLPPSYGMDFSPLVVFIIISVIQTVILRF